MVNKLPFKSGKKSNYNALLFLNSVYDIVISLELFHFIPHSALHIRTGGTANGKSDVFWARGCKYEAFIRR
ncbi:hypothetical protein GCM10023310_35780 [Paenibacillus vulneris]